MATIYRDAAFRRDRQAAKLVSVTPASILSLASLEGIMQRQQDTIAAVMGIPDMFLGRGQPLPASIVRDIVLAQERMLLSLMGRVGLDLHVALVEDTLSSSNADEHQ